MPIHPYLSFEGRGEEAIAFYRRAAGMLADRFGLGWMVSIEERP